MSTQKLTEKTHLTESGQSYHLIMLSRPQQSPRRATDRISLSPPPAPPHSLSSSQPSHPANKPPNAIPRLNILQLNCFNKLDTTHELLQNDGIDILLLQEPWTNPLTYRIPPHQMWHDITPYDHIPTDAHTKFRTCIYVARKHPIQHISILPSGSTYITALELTLDDPAISKLRVMSFYNRPSTNEGLPLLKPWLEQH